MALSQRCEEMNGSPRTCPAPTCRFLTPPAAHFLNPVHLSGPFCGSEPVTRPLPVDSITHKVFTQAS
uniref:Uncharacterized protein n=1 Tax=Anguilla anguilla TaxID=7936 RepID=A0A0E9WH24_ANGAN